MARELGRRGLSDEQPAHQAATITVGHLRRAGLIYEGEARVLRITACGRRERSLQRPLAASG